MAFGISFRRTFKYRPWVGAVGRAAASADNGFNVRFHLLEAGLDTIGRRFGEVGTAQDRLVGTGEAERSVAAAPPLTAVGPTGWDTSTPGEARKGSTVEGAVGITSPADGRITGSSAFGTCSGAGEPRTSPIRRGLTGFQVRYKEP